MATRDTTGAAVPDTAPTDPAALLREVFGSLLDRAQAYPQPLPESVRRWYAYLSDAGHSIVVVPKALWGTSTNPEELLVPAPVKSVMRAGVVWVGGWPVVDLPYDPNQGLITPEGDDEW